jgi:hypothetical protein
MKQLFTFILVLFLLGGCSQNDDLLDEYTYEQLILELTILNQLDDDKLGGQERDDIRQRIFAHYGANEELFRNTHDYYQQNVPEQLERMEKLRIKLSQERDTIQEAERDYRRSLQLPPDSLRMRILNR